MKHSYFQSVFHIIIIFAFLQLIANKAFAQATVTVDLEALSTTFEMGTQNIAIPVYFNSTLEEINAVDLWFQFNTTKLTYSETTSNQSNADVFSNYNPSNAFLSNTTSSAGLDDYLVADVPVLTLHFMVNDPCSEILQSDFFTGQALLNGMDANLQWTTPLPVQSSISINTPAPYCVGTNIVFEFTDVLNGQQITTYNWDLIGATGTTSEVNQTYNSAGSFSPSIMATTEAGCTYSASTEINIQAGPAVSFTTSGLTTSEASVFNNTTTFLEGNITGYNWTFGDNGSSTENNPTHQYTAPGIYQVTLVADGDNGCSSSLTQEISIASNVEESLATRLLVYPNPATDKVIIDSMHASSIQVYNSLGQNMSIASQTKLAQGFEVDLSPIQAGVYFIEILPSHQVVKLIIE